MHYIGMQAMIMANGEDVLQIYYYASYTAGSFFLPIAVVALSFSVFSSSRNASPWRIAMAGVFCGAAICGMHYVGQIGIVNYDNVWNWRYIVGSVIIAVSAATVALGVFFYLSSKWINALWKRALCASVLAGAVCLMHWTAVLGTSFRWKGLDTSLPPGLSKTGAVWVCGALALSCCFVLFTLALIFQYVRRNYTKKAQQISLALAYFDPEGSVMLDNGGHLPLKRITKNHLQFSTKDTFNTDAPSFIWMYRASRNWTCVNGLIPSMRLHIQLEEGADNASITCVKGTEPYSYFTVLKEMYCVAAEDLAYEAGLSIGQVGVLYDRILDSGRMMPHARMFSQAAPTNTTGSDIESGPKIRTTLTRGQVLFLVRHLNSSEVTHLQTIGYRFIPPRSIISSIATSMHITSEELRPFLQDMAAYKNMPQMSDAGVHLAMFVVRPIIGGFEVLTRRTIRNQLPSMSLPMRKLEQWQILFLNQYDEWEASDLLAYWTLECTQATLTEQEIDLVTYICDAMTQLQNRVGERLFDRARFVAKPLSDPGIEDNVPGAGTATFLTFRYVTDIHYVHPAKSQDIFINALLFTTSQHCYLRSSDHAVFSGQVHTEFSTVPGINVRPHKHGLVEEPFPDHHHPNHHRNRLKRPFTFSRASPMKSQALSESDPDAETSHPGPSHEPLPLLTRKTSESQPLPQNLSEPTRSRSLFPSQGGVHISNEIHITVADAETAPPSTDMVRPDDLGLELGMRTEIGIVRERESVVDALMVLTLGGLRV